MRRDVEELRAFYASPLGAVARAAVVRRVRAAWEGAAGLDVLLWGYATPFEEAVAPARRVLAAMPAAQGVHRWPVEGRGRACLAQDGPLPWPSALFDRILAVHLLEEGPGAETLLAEAARVLRPEGRILLVAASRNGVWSRTERTPFGHGRPFSRGQLESAARAAGLCPLSASHALFAPPHAAFAGVAPLWEEVGARLWPALSGLVTLEAARREAAVAPPRGLGARTRRAARGALVPAAVHLGGAAEPAPSPTPLRLRSKRSRV